MADTLVLNRNEFELPEDAKITKVFEKLMRVNAVETANGLREMYTERHDRYEESYGIMF